MISLLKKYSFFLLLTALISGCHGRPGDNYSVTGSSPQLFPDYSGIILPPNIAPLNFEIKDKGSAYFASLTSGADKIEIYSRNGKVIIPAGKWRSLLLNNKGKELKIDILIKKMDGKWAQYNTITNRIAIEPIDPFIYYRVLYPGYESWAELSIKVRSLENFGEKSLIENNAADQNCVNCHSFNPAKPGEFLFHMRGSHGGTYFYSEGKLKKVNLKTSEMENGAVYPRWHPSGKFIAFSSNKIIQQFHSAENKKIEVSDLKSSLVLYDKERNEMFPVVMAGKEQYMDTYPEWSPDGRYLYFCRAPQIGEVFDYKEIKYNLYRVPFNPAERSFGVAELIFDAVKLNKSAAFPRISPNGKFLIVTLADYGCFPIWHKEADLYSIDLVTFSFKRLELNSDFAESYHSWSSNSNWLLFSSRRDDGLTTRLFFTYISNNGECGKPFELPQYNPAFYQSFMKSYNLPEFSSEGVSLTPGEIRRSVTSSAIQAGWHKN